MPALVFVQLSDFSGSGACVTIQGSRAVRCSAARRGGHFDLSQGAIRDFDLFVCCGWPPASGFVAA